MSEPVKAKVIYHANCVDGFGAAWAFHKLSELLYPGGVEYAPMSYGQELIPDEQGAENIDLYILDFSFGRQTLELCSDHYSSVTVLDHHKTAQDALTGWAHGRKNLEIIFDMGRSGAGITWDYLAIRPQGRPRLIDYIEDRDIWIWNLEFSAEVNALIGFAHKSFEAYTAMDDVLRTNFQAAVDSGAMLLEQQKRHCNSIISSTRREITIGDKQGLVCNCPGQFASDVGNVLAKQSGTFGATYFTDLNGDVKFSLRSIGDYDVEKIAREYGGGGHKNAAGFTLKNPMDNAAGSGVAVYTIENDVSLQQAAAAQQVAAEQKRWSDGVVGVGKAAADNNDLRVYELMRGLNDALYRPDVAAPQQADPATTKE